MTLNEQTAAREHELIINEIKQIIENFPKTTNEDEIKLTEEEHDLLKLGPRFMFNDPKTASRRRRTELATLKRKIANRFLEKVIIPGRPVEQFIAELDVLLQNLHDIPIFKHNKNDSIKQNKDISSIIVSQLPLFQNSNPLKIPKKKNYELAHLYYLPKAHKPNTPLRPIISGLKHPTIKISKYLHDLLRPLFDKIAQEITETSGFELLKKLDKWSKLNINQQTLFCTIDVVNLYTMIPQVEGVLSLKKMIDYLNLKQIGGLKIETIIRLSRFVMQNNYFSYHGQFYHQIRGGAMDSPLTLTVANCYMFFYEQPIIKQINNSGGLYFRYIDDIFIAINWPARHLFKQIDRWNHFDENIKLSEKIGSTADFLDLHMENQDGQLFTTIFQKPSYEPYYLPFNSIHPLHMKKNIVFTMLLRAIRYCSTFQDYLNEREKLRIALLLNKYTNKFIDEQFKNLLQKLNIQPLTCNNYANYRQEVIGSPIKEIVPVDYGKTIFVHFTYCSSMRTFPKKFHTLWKKYFGKSPINDVLPILGTRNIKNPDMINNHYKFIVRDDIGNCPQIILIDINGLYIEQTNIPLKNTDLKSSSEQTTRRASGYSEYDHRPLTN
ncbi:unnamed protein product [Rotaria sordida]|uniref:Reverse transcriptase domain-containing protein n=2 Tax=Rotaria sordida TaxID=392033 RepID=A0A815HF61_9BILA|nr:unnamed protein product [Rotaria sordida]